ncbi:MAG: hypothetical protein WCC87_24950 [Candidatus Korobacteraceae bacterium]
MKRTLVLVLLLLVSAVWLQAQYAQTESNHTPASVPDQVQGCVHTVRGHYVITDKDGKSTELSGAANKLGKVVGHEALVTGVPGTRTSDTTVQGSASSAVEIPVLKVKTVKDISAGCK